MVNGTWKKHPVNNGYENVANWSGGAVPDGTATFGKSSIHAIALNGIFPTAGSWVFTTTAPDYTFKIDANSVLTLGGAGIVNKGTAHVTFNLQSDGSLRLLGGSSAGNAHINIDGDGHLEIRGSAGKAHIIEDQQAIEFSFTDFGSAAKSTITVNHLLRFEDHASASQAKITAHGDVVFADESTAGNAHIINGSDGEINFNNSSTAGHAVFLNSGALIFNPGSSADHARISSTDLLFFSSGSSLGSAIITTTGGIGETDIYDVVNSPQARLIAKSGGFVFFGTQSDHFVEIGSIEGSGLFELNGNEVRVGANNRSMSVTGLISGPGGSIDKVGTGTLKISHANNTFNDGIILTTGTLDIAAIGAAGAGNIVFLTGSTDFRGTLKVENAALSNHVFTTEIQLFSGNDKLLLPGLKFQPHAKATYDSNLGVLTVKSGHVIDTFSQFFNATEGHYKAVNDGHGGTKVVVVPLGAKADHADSFAFKSEVARGADRPSSDLGTQENNHVTNPGQHDSHVTGILDVALHPQADAGLWHHGDFVT